MKSNAKWDVLSTDAAFGDLHSALCAFLLLCLSIFFVGCGGGTISITAPTANAGGPYSGNVGQSITFDSSKSQAQSGDSVGSYSWDFGDNSSGSGPNPTHTYSAYGVYKVTLVVADTSFNFKSNPATASVTVNKVTPVVTVIPASSGVLTTQDLSVMVSVSGGSGNLIATGSVTLISGSYASLPAALSAGSVSISIPAGSLPAGSEALTAIYTPDTPSSLIYQAGTGISPAITVSKQIPSVTVVPATTNITAVQGLSVTVTVSGGTSKLIPSGSLILSSGSYKSSQVVLASGSASIIIPAGALAIGSNTLTAVYTPDAASTSFYAGWTSNSPTVTVSKLPPLVTVSTALTSITTTQSLSVTISVSGGLGSPTATGSVVLSSGSYTSSAVLLSAGNASITIPAGALAVGGNTITVVYTPDSTSNSFYAGNSGSSTVTVSKLIPTMTVSPASTSITPVQSLSTIVTVNGGTGNPIPSGSVILSSGSYSSLRVSLIAGSATISIPAGALAVGGNTITAVYTPDAPSASVYLGATANSPMVTVNKITPAVVVSPGATSITSVQNLSTTITVYGGVGNPTPTGSVVLSSGSYSSLQVSLIAGSATISIPAGALAVGGNTIAAVYTPDTASSSLYLGARGNSSTVTLSRLTPTVTANPATFSITPAQSLSTTITVNGGIGNPTPTGSVILSSGSYSSLQVSLVAGSATIIIPAGALTAPSNTLTAVYTPDATSASIYLGATNNNAIVTVGKLPAIVTVTPSAGSITEAQSLSVNVIVSGGTGSATPTGVVMLNYGGLQQTLTAGNTIFTFVPGSFPAGNTTLVATYTPDATSNSIYIGSSGSSTITVNKVIPTVTVSPASTSIATTQNLSVTVTVSSSAGIPTPSGLVVMNSGSYSSSQVPLIAGSATFSIPAGTLAIGSNTLTAVYTPDTTGSTRYLGSTGSSPTVMVTGLVPVVTVSPASTNITETQSLAVVVTVSGGTGNPTPTGSVLLNGSYVTGATSLSNGSATILIPAGVLFVGSDTLIAVYTPDSASASLYQGATGAGVVITVGKATPIVAVSPASNSITATQSLSVTVTVSGGSGTPVATGSMVLSSGSYTSTSKALTSGSATITIPAGVLAMGSDMLTVVYTPDLVGSAIYQSATGKATVTVGGATTPVSVSYTYDSQGRISTVTYTTGSSSMTVSYSYDNAGNRTKVTTK